MKITSAIDVSAPPVPPQAATRARVLHVSDLHFGLRFVPDKWRELLHIATFEKPDLVVVTGDLVESPWRWRLKTAKAGLLQLRDALHDSAGRESLQLICIAGNHETCLQGLYPVRLIVPTASECLGLGALWGWHAGALLR